MPPSVYRLPYSPRKSCDSWKWGYFDIIRRNLVFTPVSEVLPKIRRSPIFSKPVEQQRWSSLLQNYISRGGCFGIVTVKCRILIWEGYVGGQDRSSFSYTRDNPSSRDVEQQNILLPPLWSFHRLSFFPACPSHHNLFWNRGWNFNLCQDDIIIFSLWGAILLKGVKSM